MSFDVHAIRAQFPILSRQIHGKPLVYLDNAATTQKPQRVLDSILDYYQNHNANVNRGIHTLSDESTQLWLKSRAIIAAFFSATPGQLIITRNTTEAVNTLVYGWGETHIGAGDLVVVGLAEHHSHFVPWQQLALRKGAEFLVLPCGKDGRLSAEAVTTFLHPYRARLKVVALTHISNTLGVVDPLFLPNLLKDWGIRDQVWVSLDVAQSAARLPLDIEKLPVDSLAFSGHKLYGPMGVGGLVVKKSRLSELQPVMFGGGMIDQVKASRTTFTKDLQERFTGGTPDVAGIVGLASALAWLQEIGWNNLQSHEAALLEYAVKKLAEIPEVQLVGPREIRSTDGQWQRLGSIAWLYKNVHSHDVAQILDRFGVAVRSGHHCAMPLHEAFGWPATTRASFAVYNTTAEIDVLAEALRAVKKVFHG